MPLTRPNTGDTIAAAHVDQLVDMYKGGLLFDMVNSYGAVHDGVTDDTTAVQNAITAACASGGWLISEPGTYLVGPLTITKPIVWIGLGGWGVNEAQAARFKLKNASNANLISFSAGGAMVGSVFRDLVFDGNNTNQTTAGNCFYGLGALHCLWDHCHFLNPWQNGLHLFQDGAGGTGHHNRMVNCLFDGGNNSAAGDGRGLRIEGSDENFVFACDFENNGRAAAGEPNHIFDRSGINHFLGCSFVNGQTGIKVEGNRSKIIGCTFDGVQNHCIRLNGGANIVEGNSLFNIGNQGAANTLDGVWVDNVADNRIVNNIFETDSAGGCRSAINLSSGPATNTQIQGNSFLTPSAAYGTSAVILGTGTGHQIRNNRGYNPRGSVTPPAVPASTVAATNTTGFDCMVLVTGGTVTNVALGGTATGQTTGWFRVPASQTITLTYSVAPSWAWFGD